MGLLDYIKATGGLLGNAYDGAVDRTSGLLTEAANYKQSLAQMFDPKWQAEMRKPENMALFDKQSESLGNEMALTFAGPMAKTANLAKLKIAEQMKAKTQYELAHELAQRNAALPVEQGGLGLPAGNSAMDRAESMNYSLDRGIYEPDWYHATTKNNITEFNPMLSGDIGTHFGSPSQASDVIKDYGGKYKNESTIYPVMIREKNIGEVDDIFSNPDYSFLDVADQLGIKGLVGKAKKADAAIKGIDRRDTGEMPSVVEFWKAAREKAAKQNKSGYTYRNEFEGSGGTSVSIVDPSAIRSRFAAFDPMRRDSSDLLAGVAPWAIPAGLAGLLGASMLPEEAQADDKKKAKK